MTSDSKSELFRIFCINKAKMKSFLHLHHDGITNKDFPSFINLFRDELSKTPETLLSLFAEYLINSRSTQATLTVLTRIKSILNNTQYYSQFKAICDTNLMKSFYITNISNFSEMSFEAGYNYMILFEKDSLFTNHELDFVQLFSFLSTNIQKMKNDSISTAAKLLENFFEFQKHPMHINFSSNTKLIDIFHIQQTTYSALASICIDLINSQQNFDVICSFVRSLTHSIVGLFPQNELEQLYSSENESILSAFLHQSIPNHCFLLLLSNLIKKFPQKSNFYLELLEPILSDESPPILKCYGYTALTRITPVIPDLLSISKHVIMYLLRDYDSQNPILPSLLDNLYKTLLKRSKQLKIVDQINLILFDSIKSLSWHSMVKLMIVPDIICSFPSLFDELIGLAQDPSDYGFVTRCIKSISKSSKQSSEDLLNVIVNDTINSNIYDNLRIVRPLLEPLYATRPEIVPKAFKMFNDIVQGHDDINSKEKVLSIWLRFESLLILTRSLWPMELFDLNKDLNFAVHSGNWDLRCASLRVFNKCFNTDPIPLEFIINLKTVIYTDSPKVIFFIEDAFSNFIDLLNPKRKREENEQKNEEERWKEIEAILLALLDIFSDHMSSSYTSSHRQFMLMLVESIWKKFPLIYSQKHIEAVSSILNDPSLSLRYLCLEKIKLWSKEDPDKVFNSLSNLSHENGDVETNFEKNDALLNSLIHEISNNNFEALKELETLVADNKNANIFSQEILQSQIEKYFDFFLQTKNVGISYRSQSLFVVLANLLDKDILDEKRKTWESRLLSLLRDFDMESMRRSASLPDVTLALLRLQPLEVTTDAASKHLEIITALIELLRRTDNETEAVNSLNVIRAVLKDKITSKVEDYLYPIIFNSIFETSMKFTGFDFVAASNLCFASTFHKLFKRSDKTLNIRQFFHKLPNAKETVINGLQSSIVHANYLALTVLTAFRKTTGDDKTFVEYVAPFLSHQSSRLRRTAAIAMVSITPEQELHLLYQQTVYYLSISRFATQSSMKYDSNGYFDVLELNSNSFHGLLMVINEILKKQTMTLEFPLINLKIIPPMSIDDVCNIYSQLNLLDRLNLFEIEFRSFYYDQVSLIIYRGRIESSELRHLNDSILVALLTKLQRNDSIQTIDGLNEFILNRLKQEQVSPLIFTLSINYLSKIDKNHLMGFNPSDYLNSKTPRDAIAPLIMMLHEDETTLQQYTALFIDIAFSKDDNDTPAKIAVSSKSSSILRFSYYGKIVALLLLIDDIPIVRTKTSEIVSSFLNVQFLSEVELFDLLMKDLNPIQLNSLFLRWIKIIEFKIKTDPKGESVTTLVDEFFVLEKITKALKIPIDYTPFKYLPIDQARTQLIMSFKSFDLEAYDY